MEISKNCKINNVSGWLTVGVEEVSLRTRQARDGGDVFNTRLSEVFFLLRMENRKIVASWSA